MDKKPKYYENLEISFKGSRLHIAIELDAEKILPLKVQSPPITYLAMVTKNVWHEGKPLKLSFSVRTMP